MAKSPHELIKDARLKRKNGGDTRFKSAASAARTIGMKESTYTSLENGTRTPTPETAKILSAAYGIDTKALLPKVMALIGDGDSTTAVDFAGDLAVGAWSDNQIIGTDTNNGSSRTVHNTSKRGAKRRKAYRILDQSINKLLKPGWFAIVEEVRSQDPLDYPDHCFLVIERVRNGLTERSVRRIEHTKPDRCELTCYSSEKRYLGDRIDYPPKSGNDAIIVIGKVVGGSFDV